ncbi:MAG: histidine phosphatase family protein [Pikeienuella sp.]
MDGRITRRALLAGPAGLIAAPAWARDAGWAALAEPGTHAIMRHALAPGGGDPEDFRLDDCSTQRNLDSRGRDQARATGAEIRARGISFDRVLTSQWCRCRDTADLLGLGPVEEYPALNSFFAERRANGPAQTRDLRALIAATDPAVKLMMVTHFVNIRALTGAGPSSGEIVVLRLVDGEIRRAGSVLIPA